MAGRRMVAGDRSDFYHRHPQLIEIGNWQIALKRAIKEFLPNNETPLASNDRPPKDLHPRPTSRTTIASR